MKSRIEQGEVNELFNVTKLFWENEKKVTIDQMDWIFSNFEKIYHLWHPNCHIGFEWVIPQTEHPVNAVHWASEIYGPEGQEVPMSVCIRHVPFEEVPPFVLQYIEKDHAAVFAAIPLDDPNDYKQPPQYPIYVVHSYSETSDGNTEGIDFSVWLKETNFGLAWAPHATVEASTVENFVPQLYELYDVIENREINRKYNFKVEKTEEGVRYIYL